MPSIEIIEAGEDGYDISDDTNVIIEDTKATITKDVEFIQRYHIFATSFFFYKLCLKQHVFIFLPFIHHLVARNLMV
jgi:hypothetical protein